MLPWVVAAGLCSWSWPASPLARARALDDGADLAQLHAGRLADRPTATRRSVTTGTPTSWPNRPRSASTRSPGSPRSCRPSRPCSWCSRPRWRSAVVPLWRVARRVGRPAGRGVARPALRLRPLSGDPRPEPRRVPPRRPGPSGVAGRGPLRPAPTGGGSFALCCGHRRAVPGRPRLWSPGSACCSWSRGERRPGLIALVGGLGRRRTDRARCASSRISATARSCMPVAFDELRRLRRRAPSWGMVAHPFEPLGDLIDRAELRAPRHPASPRCCFLPVARAAATCCRSSRSQCSTWSPTCPTTGRRRPAARVAITAFVFVATAIALGRIGRPQRRAGRRRPARPHRRCCSPRSSSSSRTRRARPTSEPWDWGGRDAADGARLDAADLVPDDEAVRASPSMLPMLAERLKVYELDTTGDRPRAPGGRRASTRSCSTPRPTPTGTTTTGGASRPGWTELGFDDGVRRGRDRRVRARAASGRLRRARRPRSAARRRSAFGPKSGPGSGLGVGEVEVGLAARSGRRAGGRGAPRVPGDDQPDPRAGRTRLLLGPADGLGHRHEVGGELGVEVDPVVDLGDGHHEGVAGRERVDRQEGHAAVVAPHEAAGELAVDDPGEERWASAVIVAGS